ncbi:MAG TPA: hypothetical protein VIY72_00295 [Acidimicrobiales bacterium]
MLRSRMFTTAFRFFAGLAAASLLAAFAVGFTSETQELMDRILGPLTLGWKGGIGNHLAYTFFVGVGTVSAVLAGMLVAFRDADPEAEAQVLHIESVPLTRAPTGDNFLPALGAFAVVLTMIGLATDAVGLGYAGIAVLVCVAFVWTLRTWAERATGDPTINAELYHRFVDPLRTPVVALVSIAFVVLGLSRLLLSVSKTGSVIVFGLVATLFFVIAAFLALKPGSSRTITIILVVVGALAVLAAGIVGIVQGERDIEHHGEEHSEETSEGALAALSPAVVVTLPGSSGAA